MAKKSSGWNAIRLSGMGRKAASLRGERKRRELLGTAGVNKQNARRAKIAASGPGKHKRLAADSVKRVGEYKRRKVK